MKIGILGYGRMGHEVEKQATKRGHEIALILDVDAPLTPKSPLNGAKVLIDFTLREAVLKNLEAAAKLDVPVIEGTTVQYEDIAKLDQIKNLAVLYSPNFSIGVFKFTRIVELAAKLFGNLSEYDSYLHEWHHSGKADSPSGTAKKLASIMLKNLANKNHLQFEKCDERIDPHALHVTSTRVGRIPGTHQVGFDSEYDSIKLEHAAHGREGFAYGAVLAAEWLVNKKGIFTMDDFMKDFNRQLVHRLKGVGTVFAVEFVKTICYNCWLNRKDTAWIKYGNLLACKK